jgi:hypothetical protein
MSSRAPTVGRKLRRDNHQSTSEALENPAVSGLHPYLLQPDPEALVHVELVDHPTELRQDQFTALLVDSECEV